MKKLAARNYEDILQVNFEGHYYSLVNFHCVFFPEHDPRC
jgi:hypothetical protein